jgi:hypothetical protein
VVHAAVPHTFDSRRIYGHSYTFITALAARNIYRGLYPLPPTPTWPWPLTVDISPTPVLRLEYLMKGERTPDTGHLDATKWCRPLVGGFGKEFNSSAIQSAWLRCDSSPTGACPRLGRTIDPPCYPSALRRWRRSGFLAWHVVRLRPQARFLSISLAE